MKAKYPKLRTIQSDVANPDQIAALAARVKVEFPNLDVLMNNAGIMLYENLKAPAADLAALTAEVDVNVGGVIRMTSAFIDILTADKGTVINVSSALAFAPLTAHADLQRHQGGDSLLHAVATVPIGGRPPCRQIIWRGSSRSNDQVTQVEIRQTFSGYPASNTLPGSLKISTLQSHFARRISDL